ncbi:MAG: hypothetical protein KF778_02810 [Rhodocyclaceae bacterium]|nr:hypothetical protein [Rhodocyclaceae bacterium]MBX3667308.1 hypothetical protein [Rhodocyclaceae bacterium]
MLYRLARPLMLLGLAMLSGVWLFGEALPDPARLRSELHQEPQQTAVQHAAFDAYAGGITYKVQPLYRYDLYGLVVSRHDARTWWDYIHREWQDALNAVDFCVIWGPNAASGAYRDIHFSSTQFECHYRTSSDSAWAAFDSTAVSNNHLLAENAALAAALREARVGDQVHVRGYLAEYSHGVGAGFRRGTSTTRDDTGNGACETIYVEQFELLARGGGVWRSLFWPGIAVLGAGLGLWFAAPVRFSR